MTKFSDFKKQPTSYKNNNTIQEKDIADMIEKYSSMDRDTLMQEFLSASKAKREAGGFSADEVDKLTSTLSPYLSDEQKQMFGHLMEMGKNAK